MVEFNLFVYKDADTILVKKGLFEEIKTILRNIKRVNHREIQAEFYKNGWTIEHRIFPQVSWAWDAYKDKIAVYIELSLIDAVHRDLREIRARKHDDLDMLVSITSTFKEPKFRNVKRDIILFDEMLTMPIFLIGLT